MTSAATPAVVELFDGKIAKAQRATVRVESHELIVLSEAGESRYRLNELQWPERTRSASRVFRLPDGATLQASADDTWSVMANAHGITENPVVRWQQSGWRIALALLVVVGIGLAGMRWGVPLAARALLVLVPEQVDIAIGNQALIQLDQSVFEPSKLDAKAKADLRERLALVVSNGWSNSAEQAPTYSLVFRSSPYGPNAFALPGGNIILTDELVELADGNLDMVIGVLAHELGHVQGRHGMRGLSQTLLAATVIAVVLGDATSLITAAPLMLGGLAYTRDLEAQADDRAIELLEQSNISPAVMAHFFNRILEITEDSDSDEGTSELGLLFSSHPGSRERIKKFENAARR